MKILKLIKSLFCIGNIDTLGNGVQISEQFLKTKHLLIVTSFDDYYSCYSPDTEFTYIKINDESVRVKCKYLCSLLPRRYRYNNEGRIYRFRPYVFWLSDIPKFVKVPVDEIKSVLKYCEDMSVYDKLSKYGDFYYKLKKRINN